MILPLKITATAGILLLPLFLLLWFLLSESELNGQRNPWLLDKAIESCIILLLGCGVVLSGALITAVWW